MKKQPAKKLSLPKETLRQLDARNLDLVAGAGINDPSVYWSCVPQVSTMYTCQC